MSENMQSNCSENSDKSDVNDKCRCYLYSYDWSLNEYHAIFCPARIKGLFVPKIDQDLIQRFLETFELDEKYFITLSLPSLPNIIKLEPIQILDSYNHNNERISISEITSDVVTVLNNSFALIGEDAIFFDLIKSKTLLCFPRVIDINLSLISSQIVLLLLSTYTKKLKLENTSCDLSFIDIIKNAPNLESLSTYESSIIIDNKWIDELLQYKKGKNFRYLNITIKTAEMIDVGSLKKFVRTKCTKNVLFKIGYLNSSIHDKCAKQLNQKLLKHFGKFKQLVCDNKYALPRIKLNFNYNYEFNYRVYPLHNPEDIKHIQNENGIQKLYI